MFIFSNYYYIMFKKNNITLFVLVLGVIAYFMFMNNEHFNETKKYNMLVNDVNKLLNEYNTVGYLNRNQLIEPHRLPKIIKLYEEYLLAIKDMDIDTDVDEKNIFGYDPKKYKQANKSKPKAYAYYPNQPELGLVHESVGGVIWKFELIIDGGRESTVETNVSKMKTILVNLSNYLNNIIAKYQK